VKKKIDEGGAIRFTGEDGIGGVVVKPLRPGFGKGRTNIKDVSVGSKRPAVLAVRAVVRLGSEGRRVVRRKAVPSCYLKGSCL
jgi:hypothetical protein